MNDAALKQKLESVGQGHVLRFMDKLDPPRRAKLTKQLEALDLEQVQADGHAAGVPARLATRP